MNPENTESVVRGAVVMHNIMRDRYPAQQNADLLLMQQQQQQGAPGEWRTEEVLPDAEAAGGRLPRESKMGHQHRTYLKHYYNSNVGMVPWQEQSIERGLGRRT